MPVFHVKLLSMSVKLSPTKECEELSLLKGVLLRVDGGMGRYLSIAQVDTWLKSWCFLICK